MMLSNFRRSHSSVTITSSMNKCHDFSLVSEFWFDVYVDSHE